MWLKRRTQAEAEIECLGGPAERAGRAKATGPGPADRRREASTPSKSPSVTSQTRSPVHASDPHAYAREIARFPFPEALGAVKRAHRQGGSDELKAIVGRLRLAAGEPSQRRLARDLQLSSTAVSRVLQGTPKDDEELRLVLLWLLDTIRLNPPPPGRAETATSLPPGSRPLPPSPAPSPQDKLDDWREEGHTPGAAGVHRQRQDPRTSLGRPARTAIVLARPFLKLPVLAPRVSG